jgi:hypothetical protein
LRRTAKYASLLRISGALHLSIFEQPDKNDFFTNMLIHHGLGAVDCFFDGGDQKDKAMLTTDGFKANL